MGAFAEIALVDYHLLFAVPRKQPSVFYFCLQQTNGSLLFLFFVCDKQTEVAVFRYFRFP
jgi:hypothetical protein